VLYVGKFDPYETGGTRRAYEVVRRLPKYGVEPYILDVRHVPGDYLTRIGALRSLKEHLVLAKSLDDIRKLNVDIVVATSESPSSVLTAYYLAKKLNKPWTVIMQLPIILRYTPASTEPILIDPLWLPQQVYTAYLLRKTVVLTVSEACIIESTIKPPRYIAIKPGVGIDFEKYQKVTVQSKPYDAVFMARLTPEKGIFDIIRIWRNVAKEIPDAKLVIAGRFKNMRVAGKFYDLVRKYGLERNITYLGYVPEEKKVILLKSAKLFVYPSKLDAFPIVVLEALACGLPIVAYDIPAIRCNYPYTIVSRVSKGDMEKLAKAIIEFLMGERGLRAISSLAIFFASKFTWDNVARAEAQVLSQLLLH